MIKEDGDFCHKGKEGNAYRSRRSSPGCRYAGVLEEGAASLYVLNRNLPKAEKLAEEWKQYYPDTEIKALSLEAESYKSYIEEVNC